MRIPISKTMTFIFLLFLFAGCRKYGVQNDQDKIITIEEARDWYNNLRSQAPFGNLNIIPSSKKGTASGNKNKLNLFQDFDFNNFKTASLSSNLSLGYFESNTKPSCNFFYRQIVIKEDDTLRGRKLFYVLNPKYYKKIVKNRAEFSKSAFSGRLLLTDINNNFITGYQIMEGMITHKIIQYDITELSSLNEDTASPVNNGHHEILSSIKISPPSNSNELLSLLMVQWTPTSDWSVVWADIIGHSNLSGNVQLMNVLMAPPGQEEGGGGGGSSSTMGQLLSAQIDLTVLQSNWLDSHDDRALEMYQYLNYSNNDLTFSERVAILKEHVQYMMENGDYLSFVAGHAQTGDPDVIWWEDESWISDSNNINFGDDALIEPHITLQEKALIPLYPAQAFIIFENKDIAFSKSTTRMGPSGGLNDKKDAFRHAFYQAINVTTIPPRLQPAYQSPAYIVTLFSTAHESETPPQLILEREMDLFNNAVGINVGSNFSASTFDQIADQIMVKLNNGELRYLDPVLTEIQDPNYRGTAGSEDPNTATHGIIANTALIPTNQ